MAKQIVGTDIGSYTFTPGAAGVGTIALRGLPNLKLEQIVLIVDVTINVIIYNFADPAAGGLLAGTVLTLDASTATCAAADSLQIIVDLPAALATPAQPDIAAKEIEACCQMAVDTKAAEQDIFEQPIVDVNLTGVLGTRNLTEEMQGSVGQALRTVGAPYRDVIVSKALALAGDPLGVQCLGCPTVGIQISGTWAGTITFEAECDNSGYVAVLAVPLGGGAPASTTTANGCWRVPTSGLFRLQARMSSWTSGNAKVTLIASPGAPGVTPPTNTPVIGSQTQLLLQKSSTYESQTYDTNLATILASTNLNTSLVRPVQPDAGTPIAPTAPTTVAAWATAQWALVPQIYPRLRVEAGGSQKLPFAQDPATNKLQIASDDMRQLLEQILIELKTLNLANIQNGLVQPVNGYEEIR